VIYRPFIYVGPSSSTSRSTSCFYSLAGSRSYDTYSFSVFRTSTGTGPASSAASGTKRYWLSDATSRSGRR
jgi:hypothetical protein